MYQNKNKAISVGNPRASRGRQSKDLMEKGVFEKTGEPEIDTFVLEKAQVDAIDRREFKVLRS